MNNPSIGSQQFLAGDGSREEIVICSPLEQSEKLDACSSRPDFLAGHESRSRQPKLPRADKEATWQTAFNDQLDHKPVKQPRERPEDLGKEEEQL